MNHRHLLMIGLLAASGCTHERYADPEAAQRQPVLSLALLPMSEPCPGHPAPVVAKLSDAFQHSVVGPQDLMDGKNGLRMLAIDPTLTDLHDLRAQPDATPGLYRFSLTPKNAEGYRIWAVATPLFSGRQELPAADLMRRRTGTIDRREVTQAASNGYSFAVTAEKPPQAALVSVLHVKAQGPRGSAPVLTQANLLGFWDDYRTAWLVSPEAGSAPGELVFRFPMFRPGFLKLFLEVTADGKALTVPLGMTVAEMERD